MKSTVVGYFDSHGNFRGTVVRNSGLTTGRAVSRFIKNNDFEAGIERIEAGIKVGGVDAFQDAAVPSFDDVGHVVTIDECHGKHADDVIWVITADSEPIRLTTAVYRRENIPQMWTCFWTKVEHAVEVMELATEAEIAKAQVWEAYEMFGSEFMGVDAYTARVMGDRIEAIAKPLGI